MTENERIKVTSVLSEDLMMRISAEDLIGMVERQPGAEVVLDFDGVKSCTRSFADEYYVRRAASSKTIREVNLPTCVYQLLMVVANPRKKDQVIDIEKLKVTVL